jgi:UDP-4-amino-4,6-dideoxy-N-acetyl-beta-L-altrosamine N-acetyltransferase
MYSQHEISSAEHAHWFESLAADSNRVAMILELENCPSGFVQFNELPCGCVADWGFYSAPDAKKGAGRLLGMSALDYAFSELGYHKVCGQVIAFNKRSVSFHKALGFVEEGRLRDQYFDGTNYHDVFCFGILESDWRKFPIE